MNLIKDQIQIEFNLLSRENEIFETLNKNKLECEKKQFALLERLEALETKAQVLD